MEPPEGYDLITRRLCLIKDTGHAGVLWGGNLMAWLDEAGAVYAAIVTKNVAMVTRSYTDVDFKAMVRPGDVVEFWGQPRRWGETSLSMRIVVLASPHGTLERNEVLHVTAIFVAVDKNLQRVKVERAGPTK